MDDIRVSAVVNGEIVGYTADRNTSHTINNYIYALNASDGSIRWRYETGTNVPAIAIG
jgi:outer membrane protein assembly factor BamB